MISRGKLIFNHGASVELFLELLLMLLVLVSHDVQNGINYGFDFVRWPLHFEFPSYTSAQYYQQNAQATEQNDRATEQNVQATEQNALTSECGSC